MAHGARRCVCILQRTTHTRVWRGDFALTGLGSSPVKHHHAGPAPRRPTLHVRGHPGGVVCPLRQPGLCAEVRHVGLRRRGPMPGGALGARANKGEGGRPTPPRLPTPFFSVWRGASGRHPPARAPRAHRRLALVLHHPLHPHGRAMLCMFGAGGVCGGSGLDAHAAPQGRCVWRRWCPVCGWGARARAACACVCAVCRPAP